ncbi:MAG: NAD(P)/FAD-dependent oxidoreductase [Verrucomicrobiota bacterium]
MPLNHELFDLVIVGSAFGGSLLASIARQLGRSVVLIERGCHPRFAIGESSTPLTNLFLEQLADRYNLPRIRAFSKWGTWQKNHPGVAAGLKRGFSFYHHDFSRPWCPKEDRSNELLVAASPNDDVADTHWYRPDFDAFWVKEAISLGTAYIDQTELTSFSEGPDGVYLQGVRQGEPVEFRGRFLVDASGARGFLWNQLKLGEEPLVGFPDREALFTHFSGVGRWESCISSTAPVSGDLPQADPTPKSAPPFPPDDAALHHVFPGGWMWVLRFNNGITSAGVSIDPKIARDLHLEAGAAGWRRMLDRLPSVAAQFAEAQHVHPFVHLPSVAFCCPQTVGRRWALLPSAMGFLDPLLSTGFPLTLLGIRHLAALLEQGTVPSPEALETYAAENRANLEIAAELVGALHHNLGRPAIFQALSMLYFAAASFSETALRLGKADLAPGFLLRGRNGFRDSLRTLCLRARADSLSSTDFVSAITESIGPINVAGLNDSSRRNWYPVDLTDLYNNRGKLAASEPEIGGMLHRCGMAMPVSISGVG